MSLITTVHAVPDTTQALQANVHGVPILYQFGRLDTDNLKGNASMSSAGCLVRLDITSFVREGSRLLAHEVGHCLDMYLLGGSHGGFRDEGRVYGDYFAAPAEGFAEAWAEAYVRKCGDLLAPLGFPVADGTCEPPLASDVTPTRIAGP